MMKINNITNDYIFSGKEKQTVRDLGWLDFSARMYANCEMPIFTTQDPLAEKKPWMSPYAYCLNNPLKFVDPNGMVEWEFSYIQMQIGDQTFEVPHWERISDTGDDMEIDFYHTDEKDEDGYQLTYVTDREGNWNTIRDGRKYLKGGKKRSADVDWWNIFEEWYNGYGPVLSIFEGNHPVIADGIMKDLKFDLFYERFIKSKKNKDAFDAKFTPVINNLESFLTWNWQIQMMGTYNISFYKIGNKTLSIVLDSKSKTSFYLHLPFINNYERSYDKTRQGNTYQTYLFLLK